MNCPPVLLFSCLLAGSCERRAPRHSLWKSWRQALALALAFAVAGVPAMADPPENVNAWPDAPAGFQWDKLGPRTETIDQSQYTAIRYVSVSTGSDESGAGSATRPWKTLRRALADVPAQGRVAVFVATGTYTEDTLEMRERVDLFGGFEPGRWQRDVWQHPTILSGQKQRRVLLGADDSRLDGFVIEDGQTRDHGGAMLCRQTSPVITNNIFRRNVALGPADFQFDSGRRRIRGHNGGAIGLLDYANPDIRHNLFLENVAAIGDGGAIGARDDCIPRIGLNIFWGNRVGTEEKPERRSSNGGAVVLLNSSRAGIYANLFVANEALGGGDAGALFCEYFSWPEVQYNAFLNNFADDDGGAIDNQKFSWPKIRANLFFGNRVGGSGGAMHLDDSVADVENNIFAYNRADAEAGGFGGTHGWLRAVNNTVVFNEAGRDSGGIHHVNVKNPFLKPSIFQNNILWGNRPNQVKLEAMSTFFHYNIVEDEDGTHYANYDVDPGFRADGATYAIGGVTRDAATFTTTFTVVDQLAADVTTGRVVRIGDFWSMIRAVDGVKLSVWGLMPDDAGTSCEVLMTFHLAPDGRAVNRGVYGEFAPRDIDGEPRPTPNIDIGADEYHEASPR